MESDAIKRKPGPNKGRKLSDEWRKNLSEAHKGKKKSKESVAKMAEHHKGDKSHFWIDGRDKIPGHRNWVKNKRNRDIKDLEGGHTEDEWDTLLAQYNWTCPKCKLSEPEIKLTQDHIIPVSKGGSNNIENIQPLCLSCNCKKSTNIIKF